jgi:hypothetical protein
MPSYDGLDELFQVATVTPPLEAEVKQEIIPAVSDLELARKAIRDSIQKGADLVDTISLIAKSSEKARDFEVAGNLLKHVADMSQQLIKAAEQPEKDEKVIAKQTNVFIGTTHELLKQIRKAKNETVIEAEDVEFEQPPEND